MRRAAHEALGGEAANYHSIQKTESILLTSSLLSAPNNWDAHLRKSAASTIMSMVYSHPPIKGEGDGGEAVVRINDFVRRIVNAAYPGAHFVEIFPWMKFIPEWFPGAGWKRSALGWYKRDSEFFLRLYQDVVKRVVRSSFVCGSNLIRSSFWQEGGDERPSFSRYMIKQGDKYNLSDKERAMLAATN